MFFPELVIQKAIVDGFRKLKADPRLMDVLYANTSQTLLSNIKQFILKTPIHWSINYPKQQELAVPAIVLLLKSEGEAETFLGDHIGLSPFNFTPDQDFTYDDAVVGTTGGLSGMLVPVASGLTVESSTSTRITIGSADLDLFASELYPEIANNYTAYYVYVVAGTGQGQVGQVIAAGDYYLDISEEFDIVLDTTSVIDIRRETVVPSIEGEPSRVYDSNAKLRRLGVNYTTTYQLQMVAGHQSQILYLYSIIKALLISQRQFLEGQGMQVASISGSDFAPHSEFLPSDVFTRSINLQFTYLFSFLEEFETASNLVVCLTPNDSEPIEVGNFVI